MNKIFPTTVIRRGLKSLDVITDLQTKLNRWLKVKKKKEQIFVSVIFFFDFYHLKSQLLFVDIQFMVDILHMIYFMAEDFFSSSCKSNIYINDWFTWNGYKTIRRHKQLIY
jgi:hypothetical protein